jgi:transposase
MAMLADTIELVIGVDTHKHTHTAAVVAAATGQSLATLTVPATPAGYQQLLELADQQPGRRVWAIEGTGGYGAGLTRFLHHRLERVVELDRPKRPARRHGAKSDPLDASRAAREALGLDQLAQPRATWARAALSVRLAARRSAVQAATDAQRQLHALVIAAPEGLRERLRVRSTRQLVAACARLRAGVGPIVAATVLCAWSHPGRCRSDAAFAMLGGAAPIPASSGQTVRVRLNRSGDRHLNQALHLIVLTRLRYDPATRAYAQRRRAEGKTNREIRRCLVRYVARQLYRLLEANPRLDPT